MEQGQEQKVNGGHGQELQRHTDADTHFKGRFEHKKDTILNNDNTPDCLLERAHGVHATPSSPLSA